MRIHLAGNVNVLAREVIASNKLGVVFMECLKFLNKRVYLLLNWVFLSKMVSSGTSGCIHSDTASALVGRLTIAFDAVAVRFGRRTHLIDNKAPRFKLKLRALKLVLN